MAGDRRDPGPVHPGGDLARRHRRPDREVGGRASAFSYPLILLPFISSAFVPTETMPGPVRVFAENQPVTSIVNAIRDLFAQQPVSADIWVALAWCVGILVVAYALGDGDLPPQDRLSVERQAQSSRRSVAHRVSSWREESCSLRSTEDMWVSTVLIEMNSVEPTSL